MVMCISRLAQAYCKNTVREGDPRNFRDPEERQLLDVVPYSKRRVEHTKCSVSVF